MKKSTIFLNKKGILILVCLALFVSGCFDTDIADPSLDSISFFSQDDQENRTEVTSSNVGQEIYIQIRGDFDLATVWPGERELLQTTTGGDSVDVDTGMPILEFSNDYDDFGIFPARGLAVTTEVEDGVFETSYTFVQSGAHNIVIVLTNHGFDGPGFVNAEFTETFEVN